MRPLVDGVHHGVRRVASAPVGAAPLRGFRVTVLVRPLVDGVPLDLLRAASAPGWAAPLRVFRVSAPVRPLVDVLLMCILRVAFPCGPLPCGTSGLPLLGGPWST